MTDLIVVLAELRKQVSTLRRRRRDSMNSDERVTEVTLRNFARAVAEEWRTESRRYDPVIRTVDEAFTDPLRSAFNALANYANRTVQRHRYDAAIAALLPALEKLNQVLEEKERTVYPTKRKRRIYFSYPSDLSESQVSIRRAIVSNVEALGFEAQIFLGDEGSRGLPAGQGWSTAAVEEVMRRCWGRWS